MLSVLSDPTSIDTSLIDIIQSYGFSVAFMMFVIVTTAKIAKFLAPKVVDLFEAQREFINVAKAHLTDIHVKIDKLTMALEMHSKAIDNLANKLTDPDA